MSERGKKTNFPGDLFAAFKRTFFSSPLSPILRDVSIHLFIAEKEREIVVVVAACCCCCAIFEQDLLMAKFPSLFSLFKKKHLVAAAASAATSPFD
jgi:hypothetical protein